MKVVLDTNVWISGILLPKSIPGRILASWQQSLFSVVTSNPILDEIEKVLNYPKIQKRLLVSQDEIIEYITYIRFLTEVIELNPTVNIINELRDLNDTAILETLLISEAHYLVSGDQDLLVLANKYSIVTPKEFASLLD